jgi:hypothetical protein
VPYIFRNLISFLFENFSLKAYLIVSLFAASLIFICYAHLTSYTNFLSGRNNSFSSYFLRYCLAYYGTVMLIYCFKKDFKIQNLTQFFAVSFCGITFISFYHHLLTTSSFFIATYYLFIFNVLNSIPLVIIPLYILWKLTKDQDDHNFLGLHAKANNITKILDFLIVIILIGFLGSFFNDLSRFYPLVDRSGYYIIAYKTGIPNWILIAIYEIAYAFSFVNIELFFRGFLVIGMSKYLGKNVLLPMIVFYSTIHFGKPLPETISSLFGGYILGTLAYNTRSIREGIAFHIIMAMAMEGFAMAKNHHLY